MLYLAGGIVGSLTFVTGQAWQSQGQSRIIYKSITSSKTLAMQLG